MSVERPKTDVVACSWPHMLSCSIKKSPIGRRNRLMSSMCSNVFNESKRSVVPQSKDSKDSEDPTLADFPELKQGPDVAFHGLGQAA
jgi:hypothetical protein